MKPVHEVSSGRPVFSLKTDPGKPQQSLCRRPVIKVRRFGFLLLTVTLAGTLAHRPATVMAQESQRGDRSTADQIVPPQQANQPAEKGPQWQRMFDGKTLKDWKITNFGGEGEVFVRDGVIIMEMGSSLTGINYLGKMPTSNYEVRVEAKRIDGIDFFSTVTFPVNDDFCSLVVGGWAGPVVGISCINGSDASENETTSYHKFEEDQWYTILIRVRRDRISAWIDKKQVVDLSTKGRKFSTRAEVSLSEPFGLTCFETISAIRRVDMRPLSPAPANQ